MGCVATFKNQQESDWLGRPGAVSCSHFEQMVDELNLLPKIRTAHPDAKTFCRGFFHWYNNVHYHSGLNWLTPATVHDGCTDRIVLRRQLPLDRKRSILAVLTQVPLVR